MRGTFTFLVGIWFLAIGNLIQAHGTQILERIRKQYTIPGLAAARIGDFRVYKDAVGVRKVDDPTQIKATDTFHLGSNSKAITGTLIGMLVDKGYLNWDLTLPEALPEIAHVMSKGHHKTTIAMLGAHRTGIQDDLLTDTSFFEKLYDPLITPLEGRLLMINRILSKDPIGTPGEFFYDNTNYVILGRIIEKFTGDGVSWEKIAAEQLFNPLGMKCGFGTPPESSISSVDNPWGHMVNSSSDPPIPIGGPLIRRDNPPALSPAGRVHCDIESYGKFILLHLDGFHGRPTPVRISAETFKKLHTPYPTLPSDTIAYTYGGWNYLDGSTSPWSNGPILSHAGSNTLHYVEAILAPHLGEKGEALLTFMNVGNAVQGGTLPAGDATVEVFAAILNGTLFPSPNKHLNGAGELWVNMA
ncbi:hypothetical protein AJ78_05278 [Emergomyces pasteurianus Ep9510]|uniref:Beta-lactamase-related domain-containing protein n=1 Tax=Emergomyces pasteurianus Ep9510 TaxID=1447872 RepID=A0A1J9QGQ4_9EURO|nr:hypothetical protein AJ78_05278 [Emergomyces pasteurianus Ep9510]